MADKAESNGGIDLTDEEIVGLVANEKVRRLLARSVRKAHEDAGMADDFGGLIWSRLRGNSMSHLCEKVPTTEDEADEFAYTSEAMTHTVYPKLAGPGSEEYVEGDISAATWDHVASNVSRVIMVNKASQAYLDKTRGGLTLCRRKVPVGDGMRTKMVDAAYVTADGGLIQKDFSRQVHATLAKAVEKMLQEVKQLAARHPDDADRFLDEAGANFEDATRIVRASLGRGSDAADS
jgi:hypothetical protein